MAHFAHILDGIVQQVLVVSNEVATDEAAGIAFLKETFGAGTEWAQTSYNGNPVDGADRGPFAGIGYTWDGMTFAPPVIETNIEETP